jgi:hypothetical protein
MATQIRKNFLTAKHLCISTTNLREVAALAGNSKLVNKHATNTESKQGFVFIKIRCFGLSAGIMLNRGRPSPSKWTGKMSF